MSIKIRREVLEQIVLEELTRYLAEQLHEAAPSQGTVLDDPQNKSSESADQVPNPGASPEEPLPSDSPAPEASDQETPPEQGAGEDDVDDDLAALDAGEEPPSEEEEGTLAGELSGKTIQKISIDEDSKIIPGVTEIVMTFRESSDALRLLITKTGKVKYFYRGLHNALDSAVTPVPDDDAPENEMPGEEGEEETEDMSPLGAEDMPPEPQLTGADDTTGDEEENNQGGN